MFRPKGNVWKKKKKMKKYAPDDRGLDIVVISIIVIVIVSIARRTDGAAHTSGLEKSPESGSGAHTE